VTTPAADAAPREWAQYYLGHGVAPIPVPFKSKQPVLEEWQHLRLTPETVGQHFNGGEMNLGALLGAVSRRRSGARTSTGGVTTSPSSAPSATRGTASSPARMATGAA